MLIKKILMSSVDLFAHNDIYTLDVKQMLINKLSKRFVNICYSGLLILRVTRLIEYGDIMIVDDRLDGGATCDVKFEVEGLQMSADEVLNGCRVVDITSSGILFESQYADGLIMTEPTKHLAGIISKNMIIPVTVIMASYPVNHNKLTVTGMLYTSRPSIALVYKITAEANESELSILRGLVTDLIEETTKHKQTPSYTGANKIVYPFAQSRPVDQAYRDFKQHGALLTDIKLDELLAVLKPQTFATLPCELFNEPKFTMITTADYKGDYVEASQFAALSDFINRRLIYLQNIRGIATQYDTPDKWKSLNSYWQIVMAGKPGSRAATPAVKN